LSKFHDEDYLNFLRDTNPAKLDRVSAETLKKCNHFNLNYYNIRFLDNINVDCPLFNDVYKFCLLYTGGTLGKFENFIDEKIAFLF